MSTSSSEGEPSHPSVQQPSGTSQLVGIVAPEDTSSTKSELPPVIIPAVVPPVSAASTDAHHALSSSDEMTLTIAGPTAATQPVRTVQIVTCSDSSVASTITTSTVYCLDKLRSASATGTKLHMEPISPSLALASDLRKGSTTATKMAIATSTDEEISDEDSNDSTFRSDILDPLISCDPTITTVTSDGNRQRRPAINKQNIIYVLRSMDPNMVKTATQCLEAYIKARKWTSSTAFAREYYACGQVHLTAIVIHRKICKSRITFLQMREYIENISYLFDQYSEYSEITRLGGEIRQLILMVEYLASCLERCSGKGSTDWIEVARMFPMEVSREISPAEDLSPLLNRIRVLEKLSGREGGCHFGLGAGNLYRVTLAESIECAMRLSPRQETSPHAVISAVSAKNGVTATGLVTTSSDTHLSIHQRGGTMDRIVSAVISSPFVLNCYASFTTYDANVLLLEVVDAINLQLVLNFTKKIPEDLLRHLLTQLMMAVEHLHYKGFIHRDIKPSGLLLLPTGRIKIADLTLSKMCIGRFAPSRLKSYSRSTPYEFNDREMMGTIPYISPEVLRMRPYGRAADWWSVGMTAFVLCSGQLPFRVPKYKCIDGVRSYGKYSSIRWTTFSASQKLVSLIKALLVRRPSRTCMATWKAGKLENLFYIKDCAHHLILS
ncbi:microtubule-associated serine/threonine-protein kinase 3-like isoform X2 [Varroa destructor]|uniref:Protein kinase domain-containing protein n=1 Tax=Varroa destructor TaxID=109461 RepID=A0A7M7KNB1_VARDE|nr:microtubule-associated serine/threonine-protein kinase 3-like isoform X2 [Varroa destructor]